VADLFRIRWVGWHDGSRLAGRTKPEQTHAQGNVYRFAQDCRVFYGEKVHVMEITELTPTAFKEHEVRHAVRAPQCTAASDGAD
jgi:hypothetical protein